MSKKIKKTDSPRENKLGNAPKFPKLPKRPKSSNALLGILIVSVIAAALAIGLYSKPTQTIENTDTGLNNVISLYKSGAYSNIRIEWTTLFAEKPEKEKVVDGRTIHVKEVDKVMLPPNDGISTLGFVDSKIPTKIEVKDMFWEKFVSDYLPTVIFFIFALVVGFVLLSKMGGGAGGPMAFIKSRARVYDPNGKDKVTFADVAGSQEEKDDLFEIVDFLKNPKKYSDLGAKIPRGILMAGPPGTGKTLLARAVAGEAGVPFFSISGSEFVEMFVGVGASRVRDLFKDAKEKAPSIIFIDEIDAIGKKRSPGIGGGHDEREQTLNQILTEMDGFDNETHVIVLAATNRADVLDKALLRPGRFDRKVVINLPNLEDRIKILEVHAKGKPLSKDVDFRRVAGITIGFSGADLGNLLNEAAILAGKKGAKEITGEMIQESIEKVALGNTKSSSRMTEGEKRLTAYHEVGHAIVAKMLPHTDPVTKISIVPRGGTGGVTWFVPEKDTTYVTKSEFIDDLAVSYGGRVAEEIFFGRDMITTGASSDIEKATNVARAMITRYGFDDELGAENFAGEQVAGNYLGAEGSGKIISEKTQEKIDEKVRELLKSAYVQARKIIEGNRELHETIVAELLKKEEIEWKEFDVFFVDVPGVPEKIRL